MRKALFAALGAVALTAPGAGLAQSELKPYYTVGGVGGDDMLKMRAGPGTGFRVIAGFPDGTVMRVYSCEQTGSTRWCKVAPRQARALKGYVSWAYLREE